MARVKLKDFALARSGDKGDGSNVGIFVHNEADYALIRDQLTPAAVKAHLAGICKGEIVRSGHCRLCSSADQDRGVAVGFCF